jgi:hypothetical protein
MKFLAAPAFLVIIATPSQAADIHKNNCGVFHRGMGAAVRGRVAIVAAAIMLALNVPANAGSTGNDVLPHCRTDGGSGTTNSDAAWKEGMSTGYCLGVISGLVFMSYASLPTARFCPPKGSTIDQARLVVAKGLNEHPEDLHTDFVFLAQHALMKAWPCGAAR